MQKLLKVEKIEFHIVEGDETPSEKTLVNVSPHDIQIFNCGYFRGPTSDVCIKRFKNWNKIMNDKFGVRLTTHPTQRYINARNYMNINYMPKYILVSKAIDENDEGVSYEGVSNLDELKIFYQKDTYFNSMFKGIYDLDKDDPKFENIKIDTDIKVKIGD